MLARTLPLLAASAILGACGDDAAKPADSTDTTPGDTTPGDTTPADTTPADTGGDTSADPCTPNPCTAGKPAACTADNSGVESYGQNGTCSNDGGAPACAYPVETTTPCGAGTCQGGACVSAVAACGYAFSDDVSYVTELRLGDTAGDGSDRCCFDYDGDGEVDNKIGELVKLVMDLPQVTANINDVIAENIASGTFTLLVEAAGLDGLPSDGALDLALFYGTDVDADQANNVAGQGVFTADLFSFETGTATPVTTFPGASISNGNLFAGPSLFRLVIPLANGLVIQGDIKEARLEGTVTDGPHGGLALSGEGLGAKLGGVFHQDQLFGALNNFVANTCTCLDTGVRDGVARTVLEKDGGGTWTCNGDVETAACDTSEGSSEGPCVTLVSVCGAALLLVQPDIDAEGNDGVKESLSIGLFVKGTGAQISGVAPDVCE